MKNEQCITKQSYIKSGSGSGSTSSMAGLKMKAFSLSSSRKPVSKTELEKQKKLEADAEAAKAYEEFVATFDQESTFVPKKFVKERPGGPMVPGQFGGTNNKSTIPTISSQQYLSF